MFRLGGGPADRRRTMSYDIERFNVPITPRGPHIHPRLLEPPVIYEPLLQAGESRTCQMMIAY